MFKDKFRLSKLSQDGGSHRRVLFSIGDVAVPPFTGCWYCANVERSA